MSAERVVSSLWWLAGYAGFWAVIVNILGYHVMRRMSNGSTVARTLPLLMTYRVLAAFLCVQWFGTLIWAVTVTQFFQAMLWVGGM